MFFYLFLTILFLFGVVEILDDKNDRYILYIVSFVMFCVFSGLKYNVGTDYLNYKYYYENATNIGLMVDNGVEPGYTYLMMLFRYLSVGFIGFWFIISVINFGFKYYVFKKYSPLLFISLLIYFVGLFMERDFDGIRQGLSIGICYLTIPFILKKRSLPFFLLVVLASTIHATALVFLPAYFIFNLNFSNRLIFIVTSILVLLVVLNISFTNFLINLLPDSLVKMRIQTYMSNTDSQYVQKIGLSIGLLFRIVILCLFTYLNKVLIVDKKLYQFLRNGFFIGISISLLFNDFDILAHRVPYIYRELQIFIVPILIASIPSKKGKLISLIFVFVYSLALLYRVLHAETLRDYYHYDNYLFAN